MNSVLATALFCPMLSPPPPHPPEALDYWLQLWCEAYSWLEHAKPDAALFVCYEDLCADKENWNRLTELADIAADHKTADSFESSNQPVDCAADQEIVDRATAIYARLVTLTRARLS
jgi:hypothetical protein